MSWEDLPIYLLKTTRRRKEEDTRRRPDVIGLYIASVHAGYEDGPLWKKKTEKSLVLRYDVTQHTTLHSFSSEPSTDTNDPPLESLGKHYISSSTYRLKYIFLYLLFAVICHLLLT